ncbi:MAG: YigZ family protein [Flavobacteriales bacterium]|nr:YigZ family protein [Flavobacteriales bacterium]
MAEDIKDTYLTVSQVLDSPALFKDKGSKFFAYVYPVENEEQVKEYVQVLRAEHHSARHYCYAWRMGKLDFSYRANDDGEPSATAGVPIYNQILSFGLTNVLVVVVRYFGGTLLGVSGLINAYKTAAQIALSEAVIEERVVEKDFTADFDYPQMSGVMKIMKDYDLRVRSQDFNVKCHLHFSVRLSQIEKIKTAFEELYTVKLLEY